jgi:hypothetical protein
LLGGREVPHELLREPVEVRQVALALSEGVELPLYGSLLLVEVSRLTTASA